MEDDSTISIFPQVFRAILRNSPTLIITASLDISGNLSCADLCAGARLIFLSIKRFQWMFEILGETQIFLWLMALSGVPQAELFNFTHLIWSRVKTRRELSYELPRHGGTKTFAITTPFFLPKDGPKKLKCSMSWSILPMLMLSLASNRDETKFWRDFFAP